MSKTQLLLHYIAYLIPFAFSRVELPLQALHLAPEPAQGGIASSPPRHLRQCCPWRRRLAAAGARELGAGTVMAGGGGVGARRLLAGGRVGAGRLVT